MELVKIREIFGTAWDGFVLVSPMTCRHKGGVFKYTAKRVVGRCAPFEQFKIDLASPMEDGQLHLWSCGENETVKLLPLVCVMPSPNTDENACYFYNRQQPEGVRYVSYHFEQEADIVIQPGKLAALQLLIGGLAFESGGQD